MMIPKMTEARGSQVWRRARLVLLATIVLTTNRAASAIAQNAPATRSATQSISIPAGPLTLALNRLAAQTGLQILFDASLAQGKTTRGVHGNMSPTEALSAVLTGTGLGARSTGANSITIVGTASAGGPLPTGAIPLDTIDVQGRTETGTSPINGYVAKVSGTGTKTDTPLIEAPQSISVVGRQEMDDRGVQSVRDAVSYTPSMQTEADGQVTNGGESLRLRGFAGPPQYLDGLLTNGWTEPYGLERVEVLRGPASVLYGQSNPGGLIALVSKRPTLETLREVGIATPNFGGVQGFFDVGGKVDKDGQLLYRLTGLGRDLGTIFDNGSRNQRAFIAPAITWQPTADTRLTVLAKYQYDPRLLAHSAVNTIGTITPRPDGWRFPQNFYTSDPSYDKGSYRRTYQIGYELEHRFNEVWSVRQNLRYEQTELNRQYLSGFAITDTVARRAQHIFGDTGTFTVDNNALANFSTGPIQHNALFGVDYRKVDTLSKSGGTNDGVPTLNIKNPVYGIYSGPAPAFTGGSDQNAWQVGLYAQDQIKWDRFTLTVGGRQDWVGSTTYNLFPVRAFASEMDQHDFTGRVGLVYQFDNGIAPYFSYAESFEPQAGTTSPARGNTPFVPTTGRQYETGIRYKPSFFDGYFTAAVYDLRKQNVPTVDPDNNSFSVQTGEIMSRGFELTGVANITADLRFTASYSYLRAEVTKDNPNSAGISVVGKKPFGVPEQNAAAWIDYTFSTLALDGLGLGGGVRYLGIQAGDAQNTFYVPSATVFDAAIRYDFGRKFRDLQGLKLSVTATNLFQKEYLATCAGASFNCYFGSGRTVYATLSYKW